MTKEYVRSLIVIRGRSHFTTTGSYIVSDLTRVGFDEVDFEWEKAIFGGLTTRGLGIILGTISFCIPFMNKKGEKGIMVPCACLLMPWKGLWLNFMPLWMWHEWLMKLDVEPMVHRTPVRIYAPKLMDGISLDELRA